jgi:hypothetical protein
MDVNYRVPAAHKGGSFDQRNFQYHRAHPDVSIERHHRAKVLETGERVLRRKAVYLDTNYWIMLRDAYMGRSTDRTLVRLLEVLRSAVRNEKAICPFAYDIFSEVMKQSADCRTVTANLIDELSEGVALQPAHERIATEILHCFLKTQRGVEAVEPLSKLVWTSSSYVVGFIFPGVPGLSPEDELAIQKSYTDSLWNLGFAHAATCLGDLPDNLKNRNAALAEKLNSLNAAHSGGIRSFKQLHIVEFSGFLDFFLPEIIGVFPYLYENEHHMPPAEDQIAAFDRSGRQWAALLQESFRKNKLGEHLPTIIIKSGLAAAVRWNRNRQYKANDFYDFGHAAAALPYFDFFATEKSLHHLVTTELKYDRKYGTIVHCDPSQFLAAMENN